MAADVEAIALLDELIAIDSSNPGLVPGAAGERRIAGYVTEWLRARGFRCQRIGPSARPSVLATRRGSGGGHSLMLNGHLDTVSLDSYEGGAGLRPVHDGGNIYGRGAYDMKSGLAAMMLAASRAATGLHRGDIVLALVADEEYASAGTENVLAHSTADAAIVLEPTDLDVVIAHRGFVWADVTIHGVAAHGSRPDLGVDAITKAGHFLTGVEALEHRLARGPIHPLLGTGNVHASLIAGGDEASSYPAWCRITLERRTVPGEDASTFEVELRRILDDIAAGDHDFSYGVEITFSRASFAAEQNTPVIDHLMKAVAAETGTAPMIRTEQFWTDAALLSAARIPTVMFGVDGGGAHAAREWVSAESLTTVTNALTGMIQSFIR